MMDDRLERLFRLKSAAEQIASPHTRAGQSAREMLLEETGLSPQGIELGLREHLEHAVSRSTLSGLVRSQELRPKSHVLLSANVFVAPFRAIALSLCQSPKTEVRASRRAQTIPRLLHEGSDEAFSLVNELNPSTGDSFWAYGNDETIEKVRQNLPTGVRFHGHGTGLGVAVFREGATPAGRELNEAVEGLARDTVVFDQRGCLSPRLVLVEGTQAFAESVCDRLVEALSRLEERIPRGALSTQEQADALRYESTMVFVGSCAFAGMGLVSLDPERNRVQIPPVGRYLHVAVCDDAYSLLLDLAPHLTTVGMFNPEHLPGRLQAAIGDRRYVALGEMQKPRFDGPVDLRRGFTPEQL